MPMKRKGNTMQDTIYTKPNGDTVDRAGWHWDFVAVYKDGSELPQFNDDTKEARGFNDIDQSKLSALRMVNGIHQFTMAIPDGAKLIHFRRTSRLSDGAGNQTEIISYGFGYEFPAEHDRKGEMELFYLVQSLGGHWLQISSQSKDSMRWISSETA